MKVRKIFSLLLVLVVFSSNFSMTALAVDTDCLPETVTIRATRKFNMDVLGGKIAKANTSFPLEAGETIAIKASFTPFYASVDFGLITPDGYFYFINVDDGIIDRTIKVDKRGNYTFAVRNNSSDTINVSGYVNY